MSKIKDLNRQTKEAEGRQASADEQGNTRFRMRVAAQQFLKHHAPLLPVYMRNGGGSDVIAVPGAFAEKAMQARTLAVKIASRVMQKPEDEVTMTDARHFRVEAAEIVAMAWDGRVELDMEIVADDIASAVAGADDAYDAETIRWAQISGLGSATLTAAVAAAGLTSAIEVYDFRLGHNMVLSTLTAALLEATREAVEMMLPPEATTEDNRSLSQTMLRSNCAILRQIYESAARQALSTLHTADEEAKRTWLRQNRPLETIVGKFRTWSHNVATIAAATARETVAGSRTSSENTPGH